ncbi:hypothetical protein O3257_002616 [Salmonella enterica]|nr:hypothetical protein [Salmonella enterica]
MKTILSDAQLAVTGEGKDGRVIGADMLRNIASNFNGNHYPGIFKSSPNESQIHELIGYVTQVYLVESNSGVELYGCLEFTEYYDMATLKDTLDNRVYIAIEVLPVQPGYESLRSIWFTDGKFTEQQQPVNFRKCECIEREEQAQKTLEPEMAESFIKKYNNTTKGYMGHVTYNEKKHCDAIRVVSSFIPAINKRCKDEKSIDLIHRIISVVGASDNCRQDEIEATYKMNLEELIDRLVRDWCAAFQPSN